MINKKKLQGRELKLNVLKKDETLTANEEWMIEKICSTYFKDTDRSVIYISNRYHLDFIGWNANRDVLLCRNKQKLGSLRNVLRRHSNEIS